MKAHTLKSAKYTNKPEVVFVSQILVEKPLDVIGQLE